MKSRDHVLPPTAKRAALHTADHVNERIRRRTDAAIAYFAEHPAEIDGRLEELDREWDIERTLEANAAALAFTGVVLGAAVDRRFLALPAVVTAFLFQHALQGWCPPLPAFRRLDIRTSREIEEERFALKYLRGDFEAETAMGGRPGDAHGTVEAIRA